jgi:hypothetical protein
MIELATPLLLITLSMLIVRAGTIALQKTWLSREIFGFGAVTSTLGTLVVTAPNLARLRRRETGQVGDYVHEDARLRLRMVEQRAEDRIANSEKASAGSRGPE